MRRYESYKDSGVEWLGEVPSQWELTIGMNVFRENKRDNKGMKEKTIPLHKQGGTRPSEHLCSWRSLALALHKQGGM